MCGWEVVLEEERKEAGAAVVCVCVCVKVKENTWWMMSLAILYSCTIGVQTAVRCTCVMSIKYCSDIDIDVIIQEIS